MNNDLWVELNLENLEFNIKQIQKLTNNNNIIAVVKGNAYGHGVLDILPTLIKNNINRVGVATLDEAIEIRNKFENISILIMGSTSVHLTDKLLEYDIEQTVFNYDNIIEMSTIAKENNKLLKIHIKIDTGMNRLGFTIDEIEKIINIYSINNLNIIGIFSHFSSSDYYDKTYSKQQFNKYLQIIKKLEDSGIKNIGLKHIANSGAILDLPETYLDTIRPGKILYGYLPSEDVHNKLFLKPILSLKCKIISIKYLEENSYVGYGNSFKTNRKSKIAVLPIGYSDGYSRILSHKVSVLINNKIVPIISKICMNLCMVDITDVENVKIGDIVTIYGFVEGKEEISIPYIAKLLETNNYEILCKINNKIPRICV